MNGQIWTPIDNMKVTYVFPRICSSLRSTTPYRGNSRRIYLIETYNDGSKNITPLKEEDVQGLDLTPSIPKFASSKVSPGDDSMVASEVENNSNPQSGENKKRKRKRRRRNKKKNLSATKCTEAENAITEKALELDCDNAVINSKQSIPENVNLKTQYDFSKGENTEHKDLDVYGDVGDGIKQRSTKHHHTSHQSIFEENTSEFLNVLDSKEEFNTLQDGTVEKELKNNKQEVEKLGINIVEVEEKEIAEPSSLNVNVSAITNIIANETTSSKDEEDKLSVKPKKSYSKYWNCLRLIGSKKNYNKKNEKRKRSSVNLKKVMPVKTTTYNPFITSNNNFQTLHDVQSIDIAEDEDSDTFDIRDLYPVEIHTLYSEVDYNQPHSSTDPLYLACKCSKCQLKRKYSKLSCFLFPINKKEKNIESGTLFSAICKRWKKLKRKITTNS